MLTTYTIKVPTFKTPNITVLFNDDTQIEVPILSKVRGISFNGKRPSGFWLEPNQPFYALSREKILVWIHEEFKYIFDRDVFNTHLALLPLKDRK